MAILSGAAPIESGADLLAQDVVCNVDAWRFQGINVWANWIRYVRTRGHVTDLTVVLDELVTNPDGTITARGRFTGMREGRRLVSKPCVARYRFEHGRIAEVWSTRLNYEFMCGGHLWCYVGFAIELWRASRWKARTPQLDLTSGVRIPSNAYDSPAMTSPVLVAGD
jgi:SnoaL-like domain